MWRVVLLLWTILAPTIAGIAITVILAMGSAPASQQMRWIVIATVLGAVVALPVSALVAKAITRRMA